MGSSYPSGERRSDSGCRHGKIVYAMNGNYPDSAGCLGSIPLDGSIPVEILFAQEFSYWQIERKRFLPYVEDFNLGKKTKNSLLKRPEGAKSVTINPSHREVKSVYECIFRDEEGKEIERIIRGLQQE